MYPEKTLEQYKNHLKRLAALRAKENRKWRFAHNAQIESRRIHEAIKVCLQGASVTMKDYVWLHSRTELLLTAEDNATKFVQYFIKGETKRPSPCHQWDCKRDELIPNYTTEANIAANACNWQIENSVAVMHQYHIFVGQRFLNNAVLDKPMFYVIFAFRKSGIPPSELLYVLETYRHGQRTTSAPPAALLTSAREQHKFDISHSLIIQTLSAPRGYGDCIRPCMHDYRDSPVYAYPFIGWSSPLMEVGLIGDRNLDGQRPYCVLQSKNTLVAFQTLNGGIDPLNCQAERYSSQ